MHARACTRVRCTLRAKHSLRLAVIIAGVPRVGHTGAGVFDPPSIPILGGYSWNSNSRTGGCTFPVYIYRLKKKKKKKKCVVDVSPLFVLHSLTDKSKLKEREKGSRYR